MTLKSGRQQSTIVGQAIESPWTAEDWNEWWEHVFATVYWVNVRNGLEVHDWQVHNEPDSIKQGWGGTLQDYILFTRYTRDAIQFVYDNYLEGKTFRLHAPVTTGVNSWVEESLIQNDHVVDVVDWHNYSSSHYAGAVQVNEWIALYSDGDGKHEDTYISEWGSYRSAYGFSNALSYAKILIEHSRDNAGYVTGSAIFPFYDWQTIGHSSRKWDEDADILCSTVDDTGIAGWQDPISHFPRYTKQC